jgi:hypothetical protein
MKIINIEDYKDMEAAVKAAMKFSHSNKGWNVEISLRQEGKEIACIMNGAYLAL